jgi:protein required for attachment to host cells
MPSRLIVVADHKKAQLFRAEGRKIHELIEQFQNEEAGTQEPQSRRQGLSQFRGVVSGHFYNPHTEIKDVEKESFARVLSNEINKRMGNGKFDELILVAEPKMLGLLRKNLNQSNNHVPIHKTLNLDVTTLNMKALEDKVFA